MMHYSIEPIDRIFVKSYGVLSFTENMGRNLGKNISKNLCGKYSQERLGHIKIFATVASKIALKKSNLKNGRSNKSFNRK